MPTKTKKGDIATAKRNKAMSHPVRGKVLLLLGEEPGGPAEVAERLLGAPVVAGKSRKRLTSDVSHHIDYLVRLGCAEVVEERKRGNLVRCIYRATEAHLVDTEDWEALAPDVKDSHRRQFAQTQIDNLVLWLGGGGGMDKHFHVTSDRYWLDQEARDRFEEITERARLEYEAEAGKAAERIAEDGVERVRVASMLACIEIPA